MSRDPQTLWDTIEGHITQRRHQDLVETLGTLDDAERAKLVKQLRSLARTPADELPKWDIFGSLAVAGAAILPDARSLTAWLRRHEARDRIRTFDARRPMRETDLYHLVETVLLKRNPSWLDRFVATMADGMRIDAWSDQHQPYRLVEHIRAAIDADPPNTPAFVASWVLHDWYRSRDHDPTHRLRADPRFAALVPTTFEADELAGTLRNHVAPLLSALSVEGVDRAAVLDAALARLQRGGRPGPTNDFAEVYTQLTPTLEEAEARTRDYLALLPGSTSKVAGMAHGELIRLHDAGRLPGDILVEASNAVFQRTEKKLLRAQLQVLKTYAEAHPTDRDLVIEATAAALHHAASDIQRQAVKLIRALSADPPPVGEQATNAVRLAATSLPPDLLPDLAPIIGDPTPAPVNSMDLPRLPTPAPHPVEPITSPDELIEELLVIVRSENQGHRVRAVAVERVLEAIPRLRRSDPEALQRVAAPVLARQEFRWIRVKQYHSANTSLRRGLLAELAAALGDPLPVFAEDPYDRTAAPQRVVAARAFAAADALTREPPIQLVSLPTWSTGVIDQVDLHQRLERAATEGWEPDRLDLEQALLRLDLTTADAQSFTGLGTAAGDKVAAWIADPPRPPNVTLASVREYQDTANYPERATRPVPQISMALVADSEPSPHTGPLWRMMSTWQPNGRGFWAHWDPEATFECWPLVMPYHRDVVAAHLLPEMSRARASTCQGDVALMPLALADGHIGDALIAAYPYGLGAKQASTQAAAVDALLVIAARDQLSGDPFGRVLATMMIRKDITAKRLVSPLRDLAQAGATQQAWSIVQSLVEHLLAAGQQVIGLADILATATDIAT